MNQRARCLAVGILLLRLNPLMAADVDQADRLKADLKDEHGQGADLWIYNNIAAGRKAAQEQNKPLFVTFRCVPCTNCKAFDAEVAKGSDVIQQLAREQFISVRQVEMKGVDLSLFQFDHDLNWAAMFINADGTVYARYGTQSAAGPDAYNSIEGLRTTMERVLKLHAEYPDNRESLAGKKARQKAYHSALDMPGMNRKASLAELTTHKNCIHCHMIHDAENRHAQETGTFTHDLLWRYPLPENIGLTIDAVSGVHVKAVEVDSPAARSGLKLGEDITQMNGQVITSIADMQWVLHHLPNADTTLTVTGSETGPHALSLGAGWKQTNISWRGSLWSVGPQLRVWMPPVDDARRAKLNMADGEGALLVKFINAGSLAGKAAKAAGLKEGDVVIACAGKPISRSTREFQMHLRLTYEVGDELPLTLLRDGKRIKVRIKLVE